MADILQITLPDGTTYDIKDNNALPLTGGQVTGPVTFGDSVSIDDLTVGNIIITGAFNAVQGIPYSMITNAPTVPEAATAVPLIDGTAAVGTSGKYAKEDHVHPTDTTRAAVTTVSTQASINSTGLITFENSSSASLFTLQLPLYNGGVS